MSTRVQTDGSQLKVFQPVAAGQEINRIQQSIREKGYAVTNDDVLGLSSGLYQYIDDRFFTDELLGPEKPGLPPHDRLRARDVVEYRRQENGLLMNEYSRITMRPVVKEVRPREYNRTHSLESGPFQAWISNVLSMIPEEEQQAHGTIGFDFFRTFNGVTAYKHQDNEEFIGIYVTARETAGVVTSLFPIGDPDKTAIAVALQPGEYLFFRDRDFMHDATPLEPRFEGDKHYRDAIVISVHYRTTYIESNWL